MEIKTSLPQLMNQFGESANDDALDPSIRRFAAKNMILTAHAQRLEARLAAEIKARIALDKTVAELTGMVAALAKRDQAAPTQPQAQTPATEANGETNSEVDEEAEAQAMAERLLAETAAEAAAAPPPKAPLPIIDAPTAPVTPIRKANAGKPAAGDAS